MLSNLFFAFPPQRVGAFRIECVCANGFTVHGQRLAVRDDLADVAVLAIASADRVGGGNNGSPDRRGC